MASDLLLMWFSTLPRIVRDEAICRLYRALASNFFQYPPAGREQWNCYQQNTPLNWMNFQCPLAGRQQ
jgi:hypothetical protein